ncbi:MAG TPA: hypothetical protein DEB48_01670 [Verrucomicrobiales bacterium]|nr:hypothetical protein [Verrucomicrobiales bacterium]|tara:strand:- start:245 stop:577 length:333 start_codon:yes stop_codon:yes gene_type:complete
MKPPVLIVLLMMCLMISTACSSTRAQGHHTRERLEDGTPEAMLTEVAVRPLSLAGSALGGAIYVVYWPFAKITGADTSSVKHVLIDKPYEATFNRPLGALRQLREMDREN